MGDLCDNIGLVGVSAKRSYITASPSHHDQAISILSPLHVGHPYITKFQDFKNYFTISRTMGGMRMIVVVDQHRSHTFGKSVFPWQYTLNPESVFTKGYLWLKYGGPQK